MNIRASSCKRIRGGRNKEKEKDYKHRRKGEMNGYNIESDWNSPRPLGIDIDILRSIICEIRMCKRSFC